MKLLLDAGNSALKWATLGNDGIEQRGVLDYPARPPEAWQRLPVIDSIALCSVTPAAQTRGVIEWCRQKWACPLHFIHSQPSTCGVHNAYPNPDQLGDDRWLALIGAHHQYTGDKCIVDAGTAITIDLLRSDGQHQGGFIAPGTHTMMSALHTNTALPPPTNHDNPALHQLLAPGANTADCIRSGVLGALIGLIEKTQREFADGRSSLILTGGGAALLLPHLPSTTHHSPELIFQGMSRVLEATP